MAVIRDGKLMNSEADDAFVKEWLGKLPRVRVRIKETGKMLSLPYAEMATDEQLRAASAQQ